MFVVGDDGVNNRITPPIACPHSARVLLSVAFNKETRPPDVETLKTPYKSRNLLEWNCLPKQGNYLLSDSSSVVVV